MLRVRASRLDDLDEFEKLAEAAGTGFTSLAVGRDGLEKRLNGSLDAFASDHGAPMELIYQLMLEDSETGHILGCSAVKDAVGLSKPYYDFKIVTLAQSSKEADRRFDMHVMLLVNDFAGDAEVGTLFIGEDARGMGAGRLVAQSRYLMMAADFDRFGPHVLSELRGVVREDGSSPFFDHVTRPFFKMTFDEADRLSAASDNQFILDLMPKFPIYQELLPPEALEVIGKTHKHGIGARKLLEWEGLRYHGYIDVFDGGPLMSVPTEEARTARESRLLTVTSGGGEQEALVSTNRFEDFRVVRANVGLVEDEVSLDAETQAALGMQTGDTVRVWSAQ